MKNYLTFLVLWCVSCSLHAFAGEPSKVKADLSGRLLLDAVSFMNNRDTLAGKVNIVDLRLAGKMSVGNWYGKLDIGFAKNKVSLKDAFIQYRYRDNYFRAGYMLGYCGLDQSFSTCDYLFNTAAPIAETLYPGRRIGLSYNRSCKHYYIAAGAFMGDRLCVSHDVRQGFNTTLRGVWRPVNEEYCLVHAGLSGYFRIPDYNMSTGSSEITLSSAGVTYLPVPEFQRVTFVNPRHQMEFSAEMFFFKDRWMFQGEYLTTFIRRMSGEYYRAGGAYLIGGFLLKGRHYAYDSLDAVPMMPTDPHSLLLLMRVGASNLNDYGVDVYGGLEHDVTVGLDWFCNKYISTRLNYSWIGLDSHSPLGEVGVHLLQTRLLFRF